MDDAPSPHSPHDFAQEHLVRREFNTVVEANADRIK
jgi:hypothetical protein